MTEPVRRQAHQPLPAWSIPAVFVVGAVSQYLGAAIGVYLFETTEPATVAWLRGLAAAVALLAWRRPWRRGTSARQLGVATLFGVVTVGMNVAFYEAVARIPLGTAVAIEFVGPTVVAAAASRRGRDVVAVVLVGAGVLLLAGVDVGARGTGVLFALAAAALWAGYVLVGKRVADAGGGIDALALGLGCATVLYAPVVVTAQVRTDAAVFGDARTWLLGVAVGVLSTAVPYGLDQVVLRQVGRRRFALLLALLPVTATVVGAAVLTQIPRPAEGVGIALVVAALLLSARGEHDRLDPPA